MKRIFSSRFAARPGHWAVLALACFLGFELADLRASLGPSHLREPKLPPPDMLGTISDVSPPPVLAIAATDILVKPRAGADLRPVHVLLDVSPARVFSELGNLQVIHVPAGTTAAALIASYQQSDLVEYAEPDVTVRALAEPNDFRFFDGSLWALKNSGQLGGTPGADIKAPPAWDIQNNAANIVVAVIDTGIRLTHEDLAGNLWTNPGEIPGNGIDDDHDGYVDDVHGINALTHSGDPSDDHGHGSHVAGIIGATGNNSVGVTGVAWRVQLMALKFIDAQGNGKVSDAIACIDYARAHGAKIINASWGDQAYASNALRDAIASARNAGILFVAACGNSQGNNDTTPLYPASYNQQLDNVIAVASTNRKDDLSFFSNFGARTVDLAAPGEDIFSCWGGSDSDYRFDSGTSMAAAHVSGVAALVWAHSPSATYAVVKQNILSGVDRLPSEQGRCATGGRLNLLRALGAPPPPPPPTTPPPAAPNDLVATATSPSSIDLKWTDHADDEQGFNLERATGSGGFNAIAVLDANATAFTDTNLAAATTYNYRVRAFNGAGNSAFSNTASVTTPSPPPPTTPSPPPPPPAAPPPSTPPPATPPPPPPPATVTADFTASPTNGAAPLGVQFDDRSAGPVATWSWSFGDNATASVQNPYHTFRDAGTFDVTLTVTGNEGQSSSKHATITVAAPPPPAAPPPSTPTPTPPAPTPPPPTTPPPTSTGRPTVTVVASQPNASESGDVGVFTIRLSEPAPSTMSIRYTLGGNGQNGVDYQHLDDSVTVAAGATSVDVNIAPIDDSDVEINEPVYLMLFGYTGAPYIVGKPDSAQVTIADNDSTPVRPVATVVASDPDAAEAGSDPGTFTIRLSAPAPTPIAVRFTLGGNAQNGVDYQRIGDSVTIPAGATTADVKVIPIDDTDREIDEPVYLMLFGYTGAPYTVGKPDSAQVTIKNHGG